MKPTLTEDGEPVADEASSSEKVFSSDDDDIVNNYELLQRPIHLQQFMAIPGLEQGSFSTKRPIETTEGAAETHEDMTKSKQPFQRLFTVDDELCLLSGLVAYREKRGVDPRQDAQNFYNYVKDSFQVEINRDQLTSKIKRLKEKYKKISERIEKNGKEPRFLNPHQREAYILSKRIWGNLSSGGRVADTDEGVRFKRFDRSMGVAGLEAFVLGDGMNMVAGPKKAEMENKWKDLMAAQLRLFLERRELIKDQTLAIMDAMR